VSYGIIFAIVLAMVEHVYRGTKLNNYVIAREVHEDGSHVWQYYPVASAHEAKSGKIIYHFAASLFYGNADGFTADISTIIRNAPDLTTLVIDFTAIPDVDFTGGEVIKEIYQRLHDKKIKLQFVLVNDHVKEQFANYGVFPLIGDMDVLKKYKDVIR